MSDRKVSAPWRARTVVSAEEAFGLLGIDRSTGYKAIRDGAFPVAVLHIGRVIRVPTAALIRLLDPIEHPPDPEEAVSDAR
jgi:predicted DNA-binding transcriptional regulator AlpA